MIQCHNIFITTSELKYLIFYYLNINLTSKTLQISIVIVSFVYLTSK